MKKILYILFLLALAGCDSFLDKMPDNRTEIDSQEKIQALLTSAYPYTDYMLVTEFMSDNVDDYGMNNPETDRFIDEVFAWDDVTESDNEDPESVWEASYHAIACANEALQAVDSLIRTDGVDLSAERAEALLCRAYNHFILVNVFCIAYNPQTSDSDLGIPYSEKPETDLNPKYERGTVAEVYAKIEKDLEEALPYVSDRYYTVPKYHFNQKAAYAFAARFFLYYGKFDKSVEYANKCLGSEPAAMLRDWEYQSTMTQKYTAIVEHYIDASLNCNLLLMTAYSKMGLAFGPYSVYSRYAHGNYLATMETGEAIPNLWNGSNRTYWMDMKEYEATNLDKTIFWKLPYLFEFTDPVARIGYYRTVYPAFAADQVLLERAEANILLENYDAALDDMNLWIKNIASGDEEHLPRVLDLDRVNSWFNDTPYHVWDTSTVKKHLNPKFVQLQEGSTKENMLQCVLALKRVETLGQGLRWFDVKRYGIRLDRRIINADGRPYRKTGTLEPFDKRTAVQIPRKVRDAGITPNPRDNQ
jgi:hypothetical protein